MPIIVTTQLLGLVKEEKVMLRAELQALKECQIKFLNSAIVSVGVILGLPELFKHGSDPILSSAYLVPLVILIPCWWGFFDKAKTITRIVGYFRILERLALVQDGHQAVGIERFLGWENSVSEYRAWERRGRFKAFHNRKPPTALEIMEACFLVPSQRYWSLAYYTFLIFCVLCVVIALVRIWGTPAFHSSMAVLVLASLLAVAYSFIWNTAILWALMWGRHSYSATLVYWQHILGTPPPGAR
ncbi:MAG: hypothetical protein WA803_09750 [Steroidobacteraceae bacterium]